MNPKFQKMIDDPHDVQVTLDREDPNASLSKIVDRADKNRNKLIRQSDAVDKLIDDFQFKQDLHSINLDTDPIDSPHSNNKFEMQSFDISNKSNKNILISEQNDNLTFGEMSETGAQFPSVTYYVPLLMSTNSILDLFKQTSRQQKFQVIE